MGLPTVAIGLLGLTMAPVQAVALLVIPSLVTNVWQMLAESALGVLLRRMGFMMIALCAGTALGLGVLTAGPSHWPSIALGTVLAIYGGVGLANPRFVVARRLEAPISAAVGLVTGVVSGATGVFAVPSVPYLSALGLPRAELIQALGLTFTVCTLALAVGLGATNHYPVNTALTSLVVVLPTAAGMRWGQGLRHRLNPDTFRRWFFLSMVLIGLVMVVRAATS
jgi:uncharacterized membrane protein YfcA